MKLASPVRRSIEQAVILAGGRGTRLAPLTDIRPKALIPVCGKPFIEHLLLQLRCAQFSNVLILSGYRGSQFSRYERRAADFGIGISVVMAPEECQTGERLRRAAPLLHDKFLMMYCDNYAPLQIDKLISLADKPNADCVLTAYDNQDNYTKSNLVVASDGSVLRYKKDKNPSHDFTATDLGYALLTNRAVSLLPDNNVSLEEYLYPRLAKRRALYAHITKHRHYGIGSFERLADAHSFFSRRKYVLLDRDGVLNVRPRRGHYVQTVDDWRWLPGSLEALQLFGQHGISISVITNQAGIARGLLNRSNVDALHSKMMIDALSVGAKIEAVYLCPHHWDDHCYCRKPSPGLFFQAQRDLMLFLPSVPFVGDDDTDQLAALQAGCPFYRVDADRSLLDVARSIVKTPPPLWSFH